MGRRPCGTMKRQVKRWKVSFPTFSRQARRLAVLSRPGATGSGPAPARKSQCRPFQLEPDRAGRPRTHRNGTRAGPELQADGAQEQRTALTLAAGHGAGRTGRGSPGPHSLVDPSRTRMEPMLSRAP